MNVPREDPISYEMNKFDLARERYLAEYQITKPTDQRRPVSKLMADEMVSELKERGVSLDSPIAVVDCWFQLCITLKENGFTNLTLLEMHSTNDEYNAKINIMSSKLGIPVHTLDTNMKFDVIIGNPPYQSAPGDKEGGLRGSTKNLYTQFIVAAVDLLNPDGVLSFVTPPGYLKTTRIGVKSEVFVMMQSLNLQLLDFDCKKHFPGVGLPCITRFVLVKNKNYTTTRVITATSDEQIDMSALDFVPLYATQAVIDRTLASLSPSPVMSFRRDDSLKHTDACIDSGAHFVLVSQISGGALQVAMDECIVNRKGKRKQCHVMRCDNQQHAQLVYDKMVSDNATFINSTVRYGDANVYPGIINHII